MHVGRRPTGVDRSRIDAVGDDPSGRERVVDRPGHLVQGALRHGVGDLGVHRPDVLAAGEPQHPTGRDLVGRSRIVAFGEPLGEQHDAANVGRPAAIQLGGVHFGERCVRRTGVDGHDDVDAPVLDRRPSRSARRGRAGPRGRARPTANGRDPAGSAPQGISSSCGTHPVAVTWRAEVVQPQRDRGPDTDRSRDAGHQRHATFERSRGRDHHRGLFHVASRPVRPQQVEHRRSQPWRKDRRRPATDRQHLGVDVGSRSERVAVDRDAELELPPWRPRRGAQGARWCRRVFRATSRCTMRSARAGPRAGSSRSLPSSSVVSPNGGFATTRNGRRGRRSPRRSARMTRTASPSAATSAASRSAHTVSTSTAHTSTPARASGSVSAPVPAPTSTTSSPGVTPSASIRRGIALRSTRKF